MITQTVDLNLIPNGFPVVIHCDQYDEGTGRLKFNLYDEYVAYSPVGTAVIQGTKPDNHGFNYNCTLAGNVVTADLTDQMTAVAGSVRCQIVVTESSGRTGSFAFILEVQMSALPDDTVLSDSDFQLIQQAINDTAQSASDAEDSAEDAEAWAVGERNGVPVTSGDETYQNNSKYWSDISQQSASDAEDSAEDAEAWAVGERNGVPVTSGDPTYENNSKYCSDISQQSASDAEDSAEDAEAWAVGERNGVPVTSGDETYENNAKYWASQAGSLGSLQDVSLSSVQDGQTLTYNASTSKWENATLLFHNIPRNTPKDITSYLTDGSLYDRLNGLNGYELYEDIYVGDYWKMSRAISAYEQTQQYQTTGSQYVTIAGIDWYMQSGDTALTVHHLVMVAGQGFGGTQHFGRSRMNSSNSTTGGYVGSEMHSTTLGAVTSSGSTALTATVNQQLYAEFGSHLLTTRELLSNAVDSARYNRFGQASGATSGWAWTSCQAVLMSEIEVYGSIVWSSSGHDTGTACRQLPLFAHSKLAQNNRSYYWLKDVASASDFCHCNNNGLANHIGAKSAYDCVRPRFILA